jgi:hypothetical protein
MAASTAWVLGAGISTLALVAPGPARPVYGAWMAAARFLGRINMTILLTLVYVFMFCGLGLLLRLLGRDALHLEIERQAETYWEPKRPSEPRRYLNQF